TAPRTPPAFFSGAAQRQLPENSVALVAPYANATDDTAGYWQALAHMRFRMPEGYFNGAAPDGSFIYQPVPSATQDLMLSAPPDLSAEYRQKVLAELHVWGVQTVIVGPMPDGREQKMIDAFTLILGRPPVEVDGVYVWQNVNA